MDKLKPLLTHKFWILSVVTLIVATVGWYLGTSAQASAIQARIDTLNGLTPKDGKTTPNDDWIAKATVVKGQDAVKVQNAADYLWEFQKGNMVWPRQMREYVQGKTFDSELPNEAKETYRGIFGNEVERLREVVDPYEYNEDTMRLEGAVILERQTIPLVDPATWTGTPPSSKEIWYLQEDVWLLEALLQSVRDVNDRAGADSNIIKAPIKQISLLELRGGDRAALAAGASAAAGGMDPTGMSSGSMPSAGSTEEMIYAPPGGGSGGFGSGSMSGMGGTANAGPDFNLDEEVGPATPVAAAGSMDGSMSGSTEMAAEGEPSGYMPPDAGMGGGGFGMPSGMGGTSRNPLLDQKRYVDDAPELPYKTRAFKVAVVMDHRQIPEFLIELTNSPFPVNIERVHWSEMNPDPRYKSAGGGYAGMSGMEGTDGYSPPGVSGPMGGSRGAPMGFGAPGRSSVPMPGLGRTPMPMGRPFGGSPMGGLRGPMGGSFGNPMGGSFPGMEMEGVDGMGGYGMGGFGNRTGSDPASQALTDPYLAQVVIGGVMTLYRSPEDVQTSVAEAGAAGTATTPAATPDAAAGTTPATPAPANGAAPMGLAPTTPPTDPAAGGIAPPAGTPPTDPAMPPATGAPVDPNAVTPPDTAAPPDSAASVDPATAPPNGAAPPDAATPPDAGAPPASDPVNGPPQ